MYSIQRATRSRSIYGVYPVEYCPSRTRKVSSLNFLAPANIRSRALRSEVELQYQCSQLEKLKSTNSLFQKDLVQLRQKLNNQCEKIGEATEEAFGEWSASVLRDELNAAATRNAEEEQFIDLLKQILLKSWPI